MLFMTPLFKAQNDWICEAFGGMPKRIGVVLGCRTIAIRLVSLFVLFFTLHVH